MVGSKGGSKVGKAEGTRGCVEELWLKCRVSHLRYGHYGIGGIDKAMARLARGLHAACDVERRHCCL